MLSLRSQALPRRHVCWQWPPYLLVTGTAMHFVPVSHGSALVPGTLPLCNWHCGTFFKQPLSRHRVTGLSLVLLGILLFLGSSLSDFNFGHKRSLAIPVCEFDVGNLYYFGSCCQPQCVSQCRVYFLVVDPAIVIVDLNRNIA